MTVLKCCIFTMLFSMACAAGNNHVFSQPYTAASEWHAFENEPLPEEQKIYIKKLMLKTAQDSSIFSGSAIISPGDRDFKAYVGIIDHLYTQKGNQILPLYNIFKLASMVKAGVDTSQITIYKSAIFQWLEKIGALE